jgi:hypothetical protein
MSDPTSKYGTAATPAQVENRSPSAAPVPKVQIAGVGGLLGALIMMYARKYNWISSGEEADLWAQILDVAIPALLALLGGWITPPQGFSWLHGRSSPNA